MDYTVLASNVFLLTFIFIKVKKKNMLVSGNAGDKKNLHPGSHKFIFLTNLIEAF